MQIFQICFESPFEGHRVTYLPRTPRAGGKNAPKAQQNYKISVS